MKITTLTRFANGFINSRRLLEQKVARKNYHLRNKPGIEKLGKNS